MPTQDWKKRVAEAVGRIEDSEDINQQNKELIFEYKRDQILADMSHATLSRNLNRLKVLAEHLEDVSFEELDKSGVKDLVEWVYQQDYTDGTVNTYKNVIRSFYRWLDPTEDGKTPPRAAWIKMKNSKSNETLPKDLLTIEDIQNQVQAANNDRDKALIWLLYETGARIGEIIDLTVGDIEDRKHGKKIVIEGKTGARRLPLIQSVPHLNRWLNKHPNPRKDAPLWCKLTQGGWDDQLGYRYINEKILKKTMREAGIDKPANPHHYRHSRASYLANELKEAQLCEWFGWVQGSDVPSKYVHLSGRDIDNAYDQMHDLYEPDDEDEDKGVMQCPRCQELNDSLARFCSRCGMALDITAADELETIEQQAEDQIPEVQNEAEARVVRAVLRELRENPGEALRS